MADRRRNLYYQNVDLFKSQTVVDEMIDNLAFTFGVGRDDLNIVRDQANYETRVDISGCRGQGAYRWSDRFVRAGRRSGPLWAAFQERECGLVQNSNSVTDEVSEHPSSIHPLSGEGRLW